MTMKKFQVELPEDMLEKMRHGYAAKRRQGGYEVKNISDEELAEYFMSMGLNYVDRKISEILDKEKQEKNKAKGKRSRTDRFPFFFLRKIILKQVGLAQSKISWYNDFNIL